MKLMLRSVSLLLFFLPFLLFSQEVEIIKFNKLQEKIKNTDNSLLVVNFWTTWCAPCIKELPYFERVTSERDDVKVYLVSLDFPNQIEKVKSFVKNRNLKSKVFFLDETDPDTYMNEISEKWSGVIPVTLFVTRSGKKFFHQRAFTEKELFSTINNYITE